MKALVLSPDLPTSRTPPRRLTDPLAGVGKRKVAAGHAAASAWTSTTLPSTVSAERYFISTRVRFGSGSGAN